jgi:hypothetical protein
VSTRLSRAIIFDLRGYPRNTYAVLAPHFARHIVRATLYRIPLRRTPVSKPVAPFDVEYIDGISDFCQIIRPAAPHLGIRSGEDELLSAGIREALKISQR